MIGHERMRCLPLRVRPIHRPLRRLARLMRLKKTETAALLIP
jgi:hypothetical protein